MEAKTNNTPQEIYKVLMAARRLLFVSHRKPDGDTLGANLGLYHYIKAWPDKEITIFCADSPSQVYLFMPGIGLVQHDRQVLERAYDCICTFDAGDLEVTNITEAIVSQRANGAILIDFDHHATNARFGDLNYVMAEAASSTEAIYRFIVANGGVISPAMATCLMIGLVTDTGFFSNPATHASAFQTAKMLVLAGAEFSLIQERFLKDKNIMALRLWGEALNRLSYNSEFGVAWTYITKEETYQNGNSDEMTEGLSNFLNLILDVPVVLVLKEKQDGVKGSLRSTAAIDVAELAGQFGGGGHKRAAGFFIDDASLEVTDEGCRIV